jgi:hypothetical protein
VHDADAVEECVRLLFEVRGQEYGRPELPPKTGDHAPDGVPGKRVQTDGRLVQEENRRRCSVDCAIPSRRIMPPE